MSEIVGYLELGRFVCPRCLRKCSESETPIPVHRENLGRFSQTCHSCKEQVVKGGWTAELFPDVRDSHEFRWEDMAKLSKEFFKYVRDDDVEAAESTRLKIYERVLRAMIKNRLYDKDEVMRHMEKIISEKLRW